MTQRDGSRSLRSATIHVPREKRGPRSRFTFSLPLGHYRLSEPFVGSKIDRRTTGPGFGTPEGFRKGTRFWVVEADWLRVVPEEGETPPTPWVLQAPFAIGLTDLAMAQPQADGTQIWITPIADDMERLFGLLVPDASDETWLDHALGCSKHMPGKGDEVILHLLGQGIISREIVEQAVKHLREKE